MTVSLVVYLSNCGEELDIRRTLRSLCDSSAGTVRVVGDIPSHLYEDLVAKIEVRSIAEAKLLSAMSWAVLLLPGDEFAPGGFDMLVEQTSALGADHILVWDHTEKAGPDKRDWIALKPGWSVDTMLMSNLYGRACLPAKQISTISACFDEVDIWRYLMEASFDYKLTGKHVDRILTRNRMIPANLYPNLVDRAVELLTDRFSSFGVSIVPKLHAWASSERRLAFDIIFMTIDAFVTIIIPTKQAGPVLRRCLNSILANTQEKFEIIIIDTGIDPVASSDLKDMDSVTIFKCESPGGKFNYSFVNNRAAERASGDYLVFLNDDTEVLSDNWLSRLVGWSKVPGVGAVGAKLIYPDHRIQHIGIAHNVRGDGLPSLPLKLLPEGALSEGGLERLVRDCSAVTAACLLVRAELFLQFDGFDEGAFAVAYNDCDFGYRLKASGYRNVVVPECLLYHYEGRTRGRGRGNDNVEEEVSIFSKYRDWPEHLIPNAWLSASSGVRIASRNALSPLSLSPMRHSVTRVLLVTHNLNLEGAPLVLLDIALGLQQCGRFSVCVLSPVDGPLRHAYESAGISVALVDVGPFFSSQSEKDFENASVDLAAQINQYAPDVLIANTVISHWAAYAAKMMSLPFLWLIHESEEPFSHLVEHGAWHVDAARDAMKAAFRSVFVCESTMALYESKRVEGAKLFIYNGFDAKTRFPGSAVALRSEWRARIAAQSDEVVFLCPGTVCERKSQLDLIVALEGLDRTVTERARFVIVGDRPGPYSVLLHERASRLPEAIREKLVIVPETAEIEGYYRASDAMLFCSRVESFPRVIQEAMSCGLAIISTPVFGISELIYDNKNGLLFDVGDIDAIRRHVAAVVQDNDLRLRLGKSAQLSLLKFPSLADMQNSYTHLVDMAIQSSYLDFVDASSSAVDLSSGHRPLSNELLGM